MNKEQREEAREYIASITETPPELEKIVTNYLIKALDEIDRLEKEIDYWERTDKANRKEIRGLRNSRADAYGENHHLKVEIKALKERLKDANNFIGGEPTVIRNGDFTVKLAPGVTDFRYYDDHAMSADEIKSTMDDTLEDETPKAQLCPVCEGRGRVSTGELICLTEEMKTCHGCDGKGWVTV